MGKQKLRFIWIDKKNRLQLEPHILLVDLTKPNHAIHRVNYADSA